MVWIPGEVLGVDRTLAEGYHLNRTARVHRKLDFLALPVVSGYWYLLVVQSVFPESVFENRRLNLRICWMKALFGTPFNVD